MAEAGAIDALQSLSQVCIYETWLLHIHDMTCSYVYTRWCGSISYWGLHLRDMTRSYSWYDSFVCVACQSLSEVCIYLTWLVHIHNKIHSYLYTRWYVCRDSFICAHMCVVAHSYVCHDSFMCVPWLIHMCAVTHSYVCHDALICEPWLIHMCAVTHSYVCRDSFIYVPWLIHMCAVTHLYMCDMVLHLWLIW